MKKPMKRGRGNGMRKLEDEKGAKGPLKIWHGAHRGHNPALLGSQEQQLCYIVLSFEDVVVVENGLAWIAGVVIGMLAVIALLALLIYFLFFRKRRYGSLV